MTERSIDSFDNALELIATAGKQVRDAGKMTASADMAIRSAQIFAILAVAEAIESRP